MPTLAKLLTSLLEAKVINLHSLLLIQVDLIADGSKTSQTKNFFSSKPVDRSGTKVLAENIRNMRGSHFSVGKWPFSGSI